VKVLDPARRDAAAAKFALLAVASLALVVIAAVVSMRGELRSVFAIAAICGYAYFGGRAMRVWQGRGIPSRHRSAWRRHFLNEKSDAPVRPPKSERWSPEQDEDRRRLTRSSSSR
jgi:hypothetical protein